MSKCKSGGRNSTSRDQSANARNPNNPAHKDATDNRSNQKNPNNPAYRSSRQDNK